MTFSRNLNQDTGGEDLEMNPLGPNSQEQALAEEDTRDPHKDTVEHRREEPEQGTTNDISERIEVELHREEAEVESKDEVMR